MACLVIPRAWEHRRPDEARRQGHVHSRASVAGSGNRPHEPSALRRAEYGKSVEWSLEEVYGPFVEKPITQKRLLRLRRQVPVSAIYKDIALARLGQKVGSAVAVSGARNAALDTLADKKR